MITKKKTIIFGTINPERYFKGISHYPVIFNGNTVLLSQFPKNNLLLILHFLALVSPWSRNGGNINDDDDDDDDDGDDDDGYTCSFESLSEEKS